MPDLLTHATVNFIGGKTARAGTMLPVFVAGAMLPDVGSRAPAILFHWLGWITIPFHSIFGLLLVSYIIAMLFPLHIRRPVFGWLAAGALLHLALDALQLHLGRGLLLLFPFSWANSRWGLYWPEDPLLAAGPLLGICIIIVCIEKFFIHKKVK